MVNTVFGPWCLDHGVGCCVQPTVTAVALALIVVGECGGECVSGHCRRDSVVRHCWVRLCLGSTHDDSLADLKVGPIAHPAMHKTKTLDRLA